MNKRAWGSGLVAFLVASTLAPIPPAQATPVSTDFVEETAIPSLSLPTAIRFAADGRVFVAEKSGRVKVYPSMGSSSFTVLTDLSPAVYSYWDRGLLGMALHPSFPTQPYLYLLYTTDILGYNDTCPTPPGPTDQGCLANARLSRIQVSESSTQVGAEVVMLDGYWCQQYPSHSVGSVKFGPDGSLYVSAGDGASFTFTDYGQRGNPCGDPPVAAGLNQTLPDAEGGALRSQGPRRSGTAVTYDGTILRIDPTTAAAWPGNPLIGGARPEEDRIIAYGLRNPFRFVVQPGTGDLFIGDVGWGGWEEINRLANPGTTLRNFGWPCYEGTGRNPGYDGANITLCETLYNSPGAVTSPFFAYQHGVSLAGCAGSTSSITGLDFYHGASFPAKYTGALFFADYSRQCIFAMLANTSGQPDPSQIELIATSAPAVDLVIGPDGHLYYVDHLGGRVQRIRPASAPPPPPPPPPPDGDGFVRLPGSSGSHISAPDHNRLDITGDIDIRADVALDDWATNSGKFVSKLGDAYEFMLNGTTKGLRIAWYEQEGALRIRNSNSVLPAQPGDRLQVRVTLDTDNGAGGHTATFYYRTDTTQPLTDHTGWTQLGSPIAASGTSSIRGGTSSVVMGSHVNGTAEFWAGNYYRALILDGIGASGTVAANPDFTTTTQLTSTPPNYTTWQDTPGNTWTLNGTTTYQQGDTSTNQPPTATIISPTSSTTWAVGETISFSGSGSDPEDGNLPASAMSWALVIHHCATPSDCHQHPVETFGGVSSGTFVAPDHEHPSYLELTLTVSDQDGASGSSSVVLQPKTVDLTFQTDPTGLTLTVGSLSQTAPFTRTVIVGSTNSIAAPSPQTLNDTTYVFSSWSQGGAAAQELIAPTSATTYTATYTADTSTNQPPTAVMSASPVSGVAPLTVNFDGSGSSDPDGDTLTYAWDLNGNGQFTDATGPTATWTYTSAGVYQPALRVSDGNGGTHTTSTTITVDAPPPPDGDGFVRLPGSSGSHISAPDHNRLDITGDIDIRADVALDDWATNSGKFVSKLGDAYEFMLNGTTKGLRIAWYEQEGALRIRNSNSVLPAQPGDRLQVRVTLDTDNGAGGHTATFYYRTDTSLPLTDHTGWTQLGSPIAASGTSSIRGGTSSVVMGSHVNGTAEFWAGNYYRALILDGIGASGTVAANPDFTTTTQLTSTPPNYTTWQDTPGNTWTLNGTTTYQQGDTSTNQPPTAVMSASPVSGVAPLTVNFDGSGSSDPDGDTLTYAWDLNGNGQFTDATGPTATWTYTSAGVYQPALRVSDGNGGTHTTSTTITVDAPPPPGGDGFVRLPGSSGSHISAPDHNRLDITGDIDIRADVALDDWATNSGKFVSKLGDAYEFMLDGTGRLRFRWYPTRGGINTRTSSIALPVESGDRMQIRVTLDADNGAKGNVVTFYYRTDTSLPLTDHTGWTQLGSPVSARQATSIRVGSSALVLGAGIDGTSTWVGYYYRALILDGIGASGTVAANPDFTTTTQLTSTPPNYTTWQDTPGNTWTLSGGASYTPGIE